jgi:hypothetical protein
MFMETGLQLPNCPAQEKIKTAEHPDHSSQTLAI